MNPALLRITLTIVLFCNIAAAQDCAWNNHVFKDGDVHINGHVCQTCSAGVWLDHTIDCSQCVPAHDPQAGNPTPGAHDCVYPKSDGYTYSNGAWIYDGVDDQVCGNSVWNKQTPPQVCQSPNRSVRTLKTKDSRSSTKQR